MSGPPTERTVPTPLRGSRDDPNERVNSSHADFILSVVPIALSAAAAYFSVDPVALSTAFIASGGLAFYWHNTAIVGLGTNSVIAYNRNNSQTIFLETGDYYLCVWNDSGVNVLSPGNLLVGALEFSKV